MATTASSTTSTSRNSVTWCSGNLMRSGGTRGKPGTKSSLEIVSSLEETFRRLQNQTSPASVESVTAESKKSRVLRDPKYFHGLGVQGVDISELFVTVKLFIPASKAALSDATLSLHGSHAAASAVHFLEAELDKAPIDLVLVAWIPISEGTQGHSEEDVAKRQQDFLDIWKLLEGLVDRGSVVRLGVSDFDQTWLEWLVSVAKIKPSAVHLKVDDCCSIPDNLLDYAKSQGIELLTHSDTPEMFPQENLSALIAKYPSSLGEPRTTNGVHASNHYNAVPWWAMRYTCVVKDRGIAANKGYILQALLG